MISVPAAHWTDPIPAERDASTEAPRVLHVVSGLLTGGAERMLVRMVRGIGNPSSQAVVALSGGPMREQLDALGVPVLQLSYGSRARALFGMPAAREFARTFRPDVIQGWMYHGNLAALMLRSSLASRPACIWGVRQTLYDLRNEKLLTRAVIRACATSSARADGILYNSRVSAQQHGAVGFRAERSAVIPNGFEPPEFELLPHAAGVLRQRLGVPQGSLLAGSVARFHPMKDHRTFLVAAALVSSALPTVHFVLAGRGVDSRAAGLVDLASSLGLSDRVHFLGEASRPEEILGGIDVLCSSSSWGEGFPNVLGEALARGVPCVATDVGDSGDVIGPGGAVVPARQPEALARALTELLSLPTEQRRGLGLRGRDHVRQSFAIDRIARQYVDFYQNVLRRTRQSISR